MWFDEIVPLLPYIRDINGTKQSECPLCKTGWVILEPYAEDHRQGNVKCIGTRGLNKCDWKVLNAHLSQMVKDAKESGYYKEYYDQPGEYVPGQDEESDKEVPKNGHDPPPRPEWQPPIATRERDQKPRPKIEGFTMAELMAMELPEPRWAVPGYLCEGLNILAGAQKLGKSWLVLGTAIAVATGGRALGKIQVEQGDVLCLFLEDTKQRLQDRGRKLLKGAEPPATLTMFTAWPKLHEGGDEWLRQWIGAHPKTRMVVVDTLKHIRPPRGKGGSFYDEDYEVMVTLKEIADEFGICLVVVHHVSKAVHEDVFNSVSGSMGLTGAADATLILERPRGSSQGALHITGRDVEEKAGEDAMALEFDELSGSWTIKGTVAECGMSDERRQIREVLELSDKARSPKEIADMLNKDRTTVRRLLQKMLDQGEVQSAGSGLYIYPREQREQREQGEDDSTPWWLN